MAARQQQHVSCGLEFECVADLASTLSHATHSGYQFISVPISHPRYRQESLLADAKHLVTPFARADLTISSQDWASLLVGKISSWIQVDSLVDSVRLTSEKVLHRELSYAAHLGLPAIMLQLKSFNCVNLARMINSQIQQSSSTNQVWVSVPMRAPEEEGKIYINSPAGDTSDETSVVDAKDRVLDTWEWWNRFRILCNSEKKVGLALQVSADLPEEEDIKRWLGEPIKCLLVPTSVFLTNKKGYPVMSKFHQVMIQRFFKLNVQVMVQGVNRHREIKHYLQYLDHLWITQPPDDSLAQFARGYEDYLQIPLQPLMDNLESCTYEIFEKDPIKYTEYQNAMYLALQDKGEQLGKDKPVVLMVVGAGRGPLVRAALNAAEKAQQKVKVYAVEKNPNAVITLLCQKTETWGDRVTVVSCDMREWEAPEKADILVSELLGSFGDNELSPECLDGAQKFLKEDGISIPCSYTSYLGPIQSHKLYSELLGMKERDKHPLTAFEMPYVVRLHNYSVLAEAKPLFTFHHPNRDPAKNNSRYKSVKFPIDGNCILHGFAGYFDTVLYKDIKLSIVPETHSDGMFSWFPIYFPIKDPLYLKKDSELEVHFWRCVTTRKVWYEWCVVEPVLGNIHNPLGRSQFIGL